MRIDLTAATAAALQIEAAQESKAPVTARRQSTVQAAKPTPQPAQPEKIVETPSPRKSVPLPEPTQLDVSMDDQKNVIYRFVDPNNGQTVRQVPPEEILRIMRNIEDLLQESEQKLKVTI